ncbi:hypothetical protein PC128_g18912 [Phytophthora cactorum]|nr:hypothetical protein PC128_g18912 [Phytophthora cactorum]
MFAEIVLSSAIALVALTSRADAHGYLEQPKPSWKDSPNPGWIALVDNYWDIGSGGDQVGKFKTMSKEKGMSVKDVVLDMVKDQKCGNTLENGDPQPIPSDGKVKWLGNGGGGFTHTGPCEIYLDDKMVLHGDDCENEFKGGDVGSTQTSDMPVDYSACNGKCTLSIYWLAFQNTQWQAYVNCVPLSGSGGSATQTQGSQTSSQSSETSTKQGSLAGQDKGQSPSTEAPSIEQQSPSTEQKATEAPKTEQKENEAPPPVQQPTQAPSPEQQSPQAPSSEQKWTQAPSSEKQWTQAPSNNQQPIQAPAPAPATQVPSSQQQWTQSPASQQQWTQPPSNQQQWTQAPSTQQSPQAPSPQWTQAPSNEQQTTQEQLSTQPPSTEQRSSVDFNTLNGGTGTVQPSANLRL